jgi:hypothetical protein
MSKNYDKQFQRTKANKIKRLEDMLRVNPTNVIAQEHLEKRKRQTK